MGRDLSRIPKEQAMAASKVRLLSVAQEEKERAALQQVQ